MKNLYNILRIIMWNFIGIFIGYSGYQYYHYKKYPDLYAMQSAPWYLSIELHAVFTVIIVAVVLIAMWIIKMKIKQTEEKLQ